MQKTITFKDEKRSSQPYTAVIKSAKVGKNYNNKGFKCNTVIIVGLLRKTHKTGFKLPQHCIGWGEKMLKQYGVDMAV